MTSRQARMKERKDIQEINNIGKRIEWARHKLGMMQKEIANAAGVPVSSYCDREAGVRSGLYEEILAIATVLNQFWKQKYKAVFPRFNGVEVKEVTVIWIQFGVHDVNQCSSEIIESLKQQLAEKEALLKLQEEENRRQMMLFTDEQLKCVGMGEK